MRAATETAGAGLQATDEGPGRGHLPPDLEPLLDREVEELLRDAVQQDGRIDLDELRIVSRHGVVHLAGAVPSADEHHMLVKLITDVAGCDDVVDRVHIDPLLWERGDTRGPQPRDRTDPSRFEPLGTEDVVRSAEHGLDYLPPDRPAANVPFTATFYLTYPGNQESVTIPSGYLALAYDRGVFTVPCGQFVYSANLVPGAPLEVLNTGDDTAAEAGKLAYNSAGTIAVVERFDSAKYALTFRTL